MIKGRKVGKYGFDDKLQEKASEYQRSKLLINFLKYGFFFVAGVLTLEPNIATGLRNFVLQFTSDPWLVVALYFLVGCLLFFAFSMLFNYLKDYRVEHRFGLSVQTFKSWMADQLKLFMGMTFILMIIIELIYYGLRESPAYWWFITWIFASVAIVMTSYIFPVVLMPLFYKFLPLKDKELINRLTRLAEKAGIMVIGVYEMKAGAKTKKAVGALAGIGNTRRIILSDTLLTNYTNDEIEGVIGHELGHHVLHHLPKLMMMISITMLVTFFVIDHVLKGTAGYFGFSGIGDIASLPLFTLTFGASLGVMMPIQNTISRRLEGQADQYELDLLNKPDAFISCMVKLCDQNLRYAYPHPLVEVLFYDHPSGKNRVKRAIMYKETQC